MGKPKLYNFWLIILTVAFPFFTNTTAQSYYHFEDFFSDSSFIVKNNIKELVIRVPQLEQDSSKNFFAYQKLCFNPYGKLAWYERDSVQNNVKRRYYTHLYYNNKALNYKKRVYERCVETDSLREEILYLFDEKKRVIQETFFKIYIGAYYEWADYHDWAGDSMHVKYNDFELRDTFFMEKNLVMRFKNATEQRDYLYDENNRIKRITYYGIDDYKGEMIETDEKVFEYDGEKLKSVSGKEGNITFYFNSVGLPIRSVAQGKDGSRMGFEIFYDYTFTTEGAFSTNETK